MTWVGGRHTKEVAGWSRGGLQETCWQAGAVTGTLGAGLVAVAVVEEAAGLGWAREVCLWRDWDEAWGGSLA